MNAIVFYFGIHVLIVKSNLIPNDGSDNSGLTFKKVNYDDPSSTSEANTFDEMNDEIWIAQNRKFLNETNSNMTRKKMMKREITSSQLVNRITREEDTNFRVAVTKRKFVIDKTRFIPKLLKKERKQSIMLRPYRFGKSFFLSTLKAFFEGDKDLFCHPDRPKMDICDNSDFTWEDFPILYLNFGASRTLSLSGYIIDKVHALARKYGVHYDEKILNLESVIEQTFAAIYKKEEKGVVVLLDEYDLPVMGTYFDDVTKSKSNEETIQDFFGSLKSSSSFIHFTFIFGATKVTTVGQTLNLLEDLTRSEEYSDLIGFTEEEIMETYKEKLAEIVRERNLDNVKMLFKKTLHPYYNSYQFTRSGKLVFNPLSITKFLVENPEEPKPYWAEKIADTKLLQYTVEKFSSVAFQFLFGGKHQFEETDLEKKLDRDNIMLGDDTELAKILFQAGYMSMMGKGNTSSSCLLGVSNNEANYILMSSLQRKMNWGLLQKLEDTLKKLEFERFIEYLDEAMDDFIGDEHFKYETQFEKVACFLMENKDRTRLDLKRAFLMSLKLSQFSIGRKKVDYMKMLGKVTVIFSYKRHAPIKDKRIVNVTSDLMKCHSAYVKPYADEHIKRKVICILIVFNAEVNKEEDLKKDDKLEKTGCKVIKNWAALEWFQNDKTVKLYNLHLSDQQVKEIAAYSEMDQRIDPKISVSQLLAPTAKIFQNGTLMSFETFTKVIEYYWKDPTKDPPEAVKDTDGFIQLIDKCYILVKNVPLRAKFTKIKNALLKKKVEMSPDNEKKKKVENSPDNGNN